MVLVFICKFDKPKQIKMINLFLLKENPHTILELHPTIDSFKRYLYQLPFAKLKATLYRFEDCELYEWCIIIESVIQEKISYNVTP